MPPSEVSAEQRNGEIWSTRVQKELLALTTDNANAEATEEVRVMLPSFCKTISHALDLADGICFVSFQIDIAKGDSVASISVKMDVSLPRTSHGKPDASKPTYPFVAPLATLQSGQASFPKGSTLKIGSHIPMDLDWTPSLHLTDAVLNVALKIKESILQDEPFHVALDPPTSAGPDVTSSARRLAAGFSKAFSPQARKSSRKVKSKEKRTAAKKDKIPGEVRMGDEINLLEEPWVDAHGIYSCKAIRRPSFLEDAMAVALEKEEQEAFKSPTSMFRSFTQSARSVLEESFLMITNTHIIEVKASRINISTGKITLAIPIELMAKLKFRRQESVSLFFKPAPDDPLIYMCPDSGDVVHQIQSVLKRHGVKGKHTNAAAHRAINEALSLVQDIQTKELALKHDPTVDRVNDIMDLYRQAAERFEVAGDIRHEEVVTHMRKFLALPLTISILDGSFQRLDTGTPKSPVGKIPEGEVLERTPAQLDDDDLDVPGSTEKEKQSDKAFEENIDNLLKEAQADVENFRTGIESSNIDDALSEVDESGLSDVAADLDAMMKEADKELTALMNT
jgi:hypothetical protein